MIKNFFLFSFLMMFVYVLFILIGVAFLTVFERHALGLSQNRLGPNKSSYKGLFQAIFDGLKLFKKDLIFGYWSYKHYFIMMPVSVFFLMFFQWMMLPYFYFFFNSEYIFLFFFCLIGIVVYPFMLMGFFSKWKYSMLGSLRFAVQNVSFEIVFFFLLFGFFSLFQGFVLDSVWSFFMLFFVFFIFFISVLAELNRPPFDFSEGESELVSGFNLEFGSVFFVLIFLSEYGFLIFFSVLISYIFFNGFIVFSFFVFFLLIFMRSCFPRYRYDMMMWFFWMNLLPFSMFLFFLVFYLFWIF